MRITTDAIAGTLESSDVMVKVSPGDAGRLEIAITSSVMAQFGEAIRAVVDETLAKLQVSEGQIVIDDKGALDCTIRARLQAAVTRGAQAADQTPDWSAL